MKTPGDSTQVATRRQRRIRNGKYVFCFLLFFSPIFLFEVLYVRRTSPSIIEYQNVEKELSSQTEDAKVLILGNSIPRRWHPWLSSNENPHLSAGKNDGILNLALGGAPPDDWAFLLEKSLRVTPHLKRVFAVGNEYYFHTGLNANSYLPLAISFFEIPNWAQKKRASPEKISHLIQAKIFATIGFRRELLYRFFSRMIPGYQSIAGSMEFARQELTAMDPEASRIERMNVFRSMAEEASRARVQLVFVLAPLGPWGTERRELAKSTFQDVCKPLKLECLDLSDAFPMTSFDPDKTHLTDAESHRLLEMILGNGKGS